jgi:YgiT-type zinc finger domain-containing protein
MGMLVCTSGTFHGVTGKAKHFLSLRVPMLSCPHCGESYLTAQTLREIERIKRQRGEIAIKRLVAVAVFA